MPIIESKTIIAYLDLVKMYCESWHCISFDSLPQLMIGDYRTILHIR